MPGIRMLAACPELQQYLAVDDFQTVRVSDLAAAPGTEVLPVAVEDHDRRILALEHVNAVLRIRRHPADQPERLPGRQFAEIADQLVGVFIRLSLCHAVFLPLMAT